MTVESPQPEDAPIIRRIAEGTGVFSDQEIRILQEMVHAYFYPSPKDDYCFVVYRNGDPHSVAGFACFGPTPLAERLWDLYWIGVDRTQHCNGIGSALLKNVEDAVRAQGARALYLETSSSEPYCAARRFYDHHGYERVACIDDYYSPGDGKVIYRKVFDKE